MTIQEWIDQLEPPLIGYFERVTTRPDPFDDHTPEGRKWNATAYHFRVILSRAKLTHWEKPGFNHQDLETWPARRQNEIEHQRAKGQLMELYYSMGSGHATIKHPKSETFRRVIPPTPTPADIIENLQSTAISIENARTFEEWALEFGYDEDSRRAERTYQACAKETHHLATILSIAEFNDLLWNVTPE